MTAQQQRLWRGLRKVPGPWKVSEGDFSGICSQRGGVCSGRASRGREGGAGSGGTNCAAISIGDCQGGAECSNLAGRRGHITQVSRAVVGQEGFGRGASLGARSVVPRPSQRPRGSPRVRGRFRRGVPRFEAG